MPHLQIEYRAKRCRRDALSLIAPKQNNIRSPSTSDIAVAANDVRTKRYRRDVFLSLIAPKSHSYSPLILLDKMKFVQRLFATMLPIE